MDSYGWIIQTKSKIDQVKVIIWNSKIFGFDEWFTSVELSCKNYTGNIMENEWKW